MDAVWGPWSQGCLVRYQNMAVIDANDVFLFKWILEKSDLLSLPSNPICTPKKGSTVCNPSPDLHMCGRWAKSVILVREKDHECENWLHLQNQTFWTCKKRQKHEDYLQTLSSSLCRPWKLNTMMMKQHLCRGHSVFHAATADCWRHLGRS